MRGVCGQFVRQAGELDARAIDRCVVTQTLLWTVAVEPTFARVLCPRCLVTCAVNEHEHVTSSPVAYQALGAGVMTSGQQRRKLGYMDFMPQMQEKRLIKDNKYETFR